MADLISRNSSSPRMQNNKKSPRKTRRPVTPGKSKAKTGRDLWMAALKKRQTLILPNTYRPGSPRHKTTTEYFIDTLRKTGVGISAETNKSHNMTGLKGDSLHYPYLSTSHYLRQVVGAEKLPRTVDDPTARTNAGTPAYKTQEEYYDEILALRKQIAALTLENGTNKTRIRRLEEENTKKEKEMDSLLNTDKNADLRRTIGDRQADSGAVVHSLKQKILKLEMQLRDKESAFCKLQADLKSTKVDEMRVQLETVYAELIRLQLSKESGTDKSKSVNNSAAKVKALNETVIRLSRSNEQLQVENKSLKEDLDKALQGSDMKIDTKKEYEDMNRTELLMVIANLDKKLDQADNDRMSLFSQESSVKQQAKMELRGSVEDRLQQLDQRETELLDEVAKLKTVMRRSREEKRKGDDIASLPPTPRKRQSKQIEDDRGSRPVSARHSPPVSARHSPPVSARHSPPVSARQSPSRRLSSVSHDNRIEKRLQGPSEDEVNYFRENRAAKKLQHTWLGYKQRRNDEDMDDAAFTIQEALKGSHARRQKIHHWTQEDYDSGSTLTDTDDGAYLIQSSLKGHRNRQQQLRNWRNQNIGGDDESVASFGRRHSPTQQRSPSASRRMSASRPSLGSQSLTDRRPSSAHKPSSASSSKRGSISQTFKAKYDVPGSSHVADYADDDDDDIMF